MTLSPPKKDLKNRVYNYKYELLDLSIRAIQLLDSSYYFYDRFAQLFPSPSVNVVQLQRGGFIFSFFGGREITRHAFSFGNIDDNHRTAAHSCCVLCRSYRAAMRRMNHSLWSWHLKVAVHTTLHCTIIFVSFFLNIVPRRRAQHTSRKPQPARGISVCCTIVFLHLSCVHIRESTQIILHIYIYMLSCSNLIFLLLSLFPLPLGFFTVGISSVELLDDHLLCINDLERVDVLHGQRVADCGGAEWINGTSFLSRRFVSYNPYA